MDLRKIYDEKVNLNISDEIQPVFNDKDSINLVFAPDNDFFKYFGVALQSLIENSNREMNYDIIIFASDITDENKIRALESLPSNFSLRFFDVDDYINKVFSYLEFPPCLYWSFSMYYRIFIPLIMKNYSKVLYLDSDICINSDLKDLFSINFDSTQQIAVTRDSVTQIFSREEKLKNFMLNILRLDNHENYFNSGVILFNLKNINTDDYINDFQNALKTKKLKFPDQDILNIIFQNKALFLDKIWNYEYGTIAFDFNYLSHLTNNNYLKFLETRKNAKIIHYTTSRKPWLRPSTIDADIFWKYARKSPFYENIIYSNSDDKIFTALNHRIQYLKYLRVKILHIITFGKLKQHYQIKKDKLKKIVRKYRSFNENN